MMKSRLVFLIFTMMFSFGLVVAIDVAPSNFDPTPKLIDNTNYIYFQTQNWDDTYLIGFDKSNARLGWGFVRNDNFHMVGEMIPFLIVVYNGNPYIVPLQGDASHALTHTLDNKTIYISAQNVPITGYNYNNIYDSLNSEIDVNWYNLTFDGTSLRLKFDIDHDNIGLFTRTGFGFIFVPSDELLQFAVDKTYAGMTSDDVIRFLMNNDELVGNFNWADIAVAGSTRYSEIKILPIDGENIPTLMVGYVYPDVRQWYLDPIYYADYSPAPVEWLSGSTGINVYNDTIFYSINITSGIKDGSDSTTYITALNKSIAYDDFETGDGVGGYGWDSFWYFSGTADISTLGSPCNGSNQLRLRDVSWAERDVDLTGETDVWVGFWVKASSLEIGEYVYAYIETSPNSGSYQLLETWTDGNDDGICRYYEYNLNDYSVTYGDSIAIAFEAVTSGVGDYFYADNVEFFRKNQSAIVSRWNETYESGWDYYLRVRRTTTENTTFNICSYNNTSSLSGNCTTYNSFGGVGWYNINITNLMIEENKYGLGYSQFRFFGNKKVDISEVYLRKEINDTTLPQISGCSVNDSYIEAAEIARFQCNYTDNLGILNVTSYIDSEEYSFTRGDEDVWYYDFKCDAPKRWLNMTVTNTTDLAGNMNGTFPSNVATYCDFVDNLIVSIEPNKYSYIYGEDFIINGLIEYNISGDLLGDGDSSVNISMIDPLGHVVIDNASMTYLVDGNFRYADLAESDGDFGVFMIYVYACDQWDNCGSSSREVEIILDEDLYIDYHVTLEWNESAPPPLKYMTVLENVTVSNSHPSSDIILDVLRFDPIHHLAEYIIFNWTDAIYSNHSEIYFSITGDGIQGERIHFYDVLIPADGEVHVKVWYTNGLYFGLVGMVDSLNNSYYPQLLSDYDYIINNTSDPLLLSTAYELKSNYEYLMSILVNIQMGVMGGELSADEFVGLITQEMIENRRYDNCISLFLKMQSIRDQLETVSWFEQIWDWLTTTLFGWMNNTEIVLNNIYNQVNNTYDRINDTYNLITNLNITGGFFNISQQIDDSTDYLGNLIINRTSILWNDSVLPYFTSVAEDLNLLKMMSLCSPLGYTMYGYAYFGNDTNACNDFMISIKTPIALSDPDHTWIDSINDAFEYMNDTAASNYVLDPLHDFLKTPNPLNASRMGIIETGIRFAYSSGFVIFKIFEAMF